MKPKFEIGDEVICIGTGGVVYGEGTIVGMAFFKKGSVDREGYTATDDCWGYDVSPDPIPDGTEWGEDNLRPKPKDDFKRFMDKALEPVNIEGGLEVMTYESQVHSR